MALMRWSSAFAAWPKNWPLKRVASVFLYELVTGGGLLGEPLPSSLLAEGHAMLAALAADFALLPGVQLTSLRDHRLPAPALAGCHFETVSSVAEEQAAFDRLAATSDWTLLIAPESEGLLLTRAKRVEAAGGRLLGPGPEFIALAADKQRTAEFLAASGVPVPTGRLLSSGDTLPADFSYPAVLKPNDGAGSCNLRLLTAAQVDVPLHASSLWRLETFQPGRSVSVAVLGGQKNSILLPACEQHLSDDGEFRYQGGALPLQPELAARACALAEKVVAAVKVPLGYWGLDLVLGATSDGSDDVVIEINPRLTTSYVGLRTASETNLAGAMLALAAGEGGVVSFRSQRVQFRHDGTLAMIDGEPSR